MSEALARRQRSNVMAIDIERLLRWTYYTQQTMGVINAGMDAIERVLSGEDAYAVSTDGVVALMRIAELGYKIGGGGVANCTTLPQDAETVHGAVMTLPTEVARLVIHHARSLSRPDAPCEQPRASPFLDARGRPKQDYPAGDTGRNYGWCLVKWTPDPVVLEGKRILYSMWHNGLTQLSYRLLAEDRLVEWRVDGFRAPAKPWA